MVNNNYLADILRVCEIKDLIWVMRFKSPLVYFGGGGGGEGGGAHAFNLVLAVNEFSD